ncbi:hypothetical protein JCM3766R1_000980 [Sporobolomyces carnicolor]
MLSNRTAKLTRWWKGHGAIRLEDEDEGSVLNEKRTLPFSSGDLDGMWQLEGVVEESYTQCRLLLECVLASIWNGLCLGYLLLFPMLDTATGETLSPRPAFLHILFGLVALPLVVGMCAGADVMFGQSETEKSRRDKRSRQTSILVVLGFLGCCIGIWVIVAFVVREQTLWLQLDLFATTLCAQALLIRSTISGRSEEDAVGEEVGIYEFLRETAESPSSEQQRNVLVTIAAPLSLALDICE